MTQATQQVLREALREPGNKFYGFEIGQAAGLPSGTITPILARLEAAGILTSKVEDIDPHVAGRPRRKYYWFTPDGAERGRTELARAYKPARTANRRVALGFTGGAS
jgi:PadR family transcriptional regulator, regulatory protein PadR